jgi:hypothetical protein
VNRLASLVFAAVAALLSCSLGAVAQDAHTLTTWKLNVSTSVIRVGQHYQSSTMTIDRDGDWVSVHVEPVTSDGQRFSASYRAKYDGNEYPVTGDLPDGADRVAMRQVDAVTLERVDKRQGQIVSIVTMIRSQGGKVLTITHKGTRPDGQPFDHTLVYEQQ